MLKQFLRIEIREYTKRNGKTFETNLFTPMKYLFVMVHYVLITLWSCQSVLYAVHAFVVINSKTAVMN